MKETTVRRRPGRWAFSLRALIGLVLIGGGSISYWLYLGRVQS